MEPNNKKDLNNKIIILRKHLKSTFNLTKLNLAKKIKKSKDPKQIARKQSELECFKRIKFTDISLSLGVHPEKLKKTMTNSLSSESDRVTAMVLLNKQIQETLTSLTESYGVEFVETFLISNENNIKKNITSKLNGDSKKSKKSKKTADEDDTRSDEDEAANESEDEGVDIDNELSEDDKEEELKLKNTKPNQAKEKTSSTFKPTKKLTKPKPPKSANIKKSVDSFFVSAAGENYYASVAAASSSDSEGEVKEKPQKKQKLDKKQKANVRADPQVNFKKQKVEPKKVMKPEIQAKIKPAASTDDDIHPSWKAKAQMRKSQIQTFAGKKIKFDD